MPQLGPIGEVVLDVQSNLVVGGSVQIFREGATVDGGVAGAAPLTLTIRHPGKIVVGDTVFIENDDSTTYSVTAVTLTTMQITGFAGTLSVLNGQRIVPSNNQPTIYSDDQGGVSVAQPLTTDAFGSIATTGGLTPLWMEGGAYHALAAGVGGVARLYQIMVVAGESPSVVYSGERDGATAVAHVEDTRFALTVAGARLKEWRNAGVVKNFMRYTGVMAGEIRYADSFAGATAGAKIAAAIADLPATGGVVDARGLTGAQSISSTLALGSTPVLLLLGAASFTLDAGITSSATANVTIRGMGGSLTTLTRGASYTGVLIAFSVAISGLEIVGLNIDNDNTAINSIEVANGCSDVRIHHNRFPDQGSGTAVKILDGASLNKRLDISDNYIESSVATQNIRAIDGNNFGDCCRFDRNVIIKTGAISLNQNAAGPDFQNQVSVNHNKFQGVDASNILVRPVTGATRGIADIEIIGNQFEDAGLTFGKGFIVVGENAGAAGPPTFRRCIVSGNIGRGFGDASGSGIGIGICGDANPTDGSELIVADNILDARQKDGTQQNSSYGIYVRGDSRNVNIHDNIIRNTGRSGITLEDVDFVDVHDNVIELAVQYAAASSPAVADMGGIQVQTGVTQARIHHNKILNPGTASGNSNGIYVRNNSTNDGIVIENNDVIDNRGGGAAMTQAIVLGATATNVYAYNNRTSGGLTVDYTQAISAVGNTIRPSSNPVRLTSNGNYTMTSAPTIPDGFDGQEIEVINVDTAESITLQDQGTLPSSNLRLGAATRALGPRDSIGLRYDATIGDWIERWFSNVT